MIPGHEASCACIDCVKARCKMVTDTNPLINKKILATRIDPDVALAFRLEEREILKAKLAINEAEIQALRDCAQRGQS